MNILLQTLQINIEESFILRISPFIIDVLSLMELFSTHHINPVEALTVSLGGNPLINITNILLFRSYLPPSTYRGIAKKKEIEQSLSLNTLHPESSLLASSSLSLIFFFY
jgi:hypothetical protein